MGSPSFDLLWAICLVFVSIYLSFYYDRGDSQAELQTSPQGQRGQPAELHSASDALAVLNALRKIKHKKLPVVDGTKLALGYNANVDVVVDAIELLENLGLHPPVSASGEDKQKISTREDLADCFKFFFSNAAAGERPVTNKELFDDITEALYKSNYKLRIGGNAALMATTLVEDYGFDVIIGGQVGPKLEKLLPSKMSYIGRPAEAHAIGNTRVDVRNDEIHIIMEYKKGSKWGDGKGASRANRFIISNDETNAAIASMEPLNHYVTKFAERNSEGKNVALLVVSGLHMLDGQSVQFRENRLRDITVSLQNIPKETILHYEHASIGDETLIKVLGKEALSRVDSLGLNEQELTGLYEALGGTFDESMTREKLSATIPDPEMISRAIEYIFTSVRPVSRILSRVHFHCFGFHIIAQRRVSPAPAGLSLWRWTNINEAAASGSVKAAERACNSTNLGKDDVEQHIFEMFLQGEKFVVSAANPVASWSSKEKPFSFDKKSIVTIDFVLVPVLSCTSPVQTVGLGDSISASALAYQL